MFRCYVHENLACPQIVAVIHTGRREVCNGVEDLLGGENNTLIIRNWKRHLEHDRAAEQAEHVDDHLMQGSAGRLSVQGRARSKGSKAVRGGSRYKAGRGARGARQGEEQGEQGRARSKGSKAGQGAPEVLPRLYWSYWSAAVGSRLWE